jgi:hypothetical protein
VFQTQKAVGKIPFLVKAEIKYTQNLYTYREFPQIKFTIFILNRLYYPIIPKHTPLGDYKNKQYFSHPMNPVTADTDHSTAAFTVCIRGIKYLDLLTVNFCGATDSTVHKHHAATT